MSSCKPFVFAFESVVQRFVDAARSSEICGPTAWDVSCLVRTAPEGFEASLKSYPGAPTWDELLPYLRARELEAVVYWQLQAQRFPEQRTEAQAKLREWQRRQPGSGAFGQ